MAEYAVLSDIHGNLYALKAVVKDMASFHIKGVILLGDLIGYGMQSNEVVEYLRCRFRDRICCNIWGNHERAIILSDFQRFSSKRGEESAKYTTGILTDETRYYLDHEMCHAGRLEFEMDGLKCLAVHGSLEDVYWKSIFPDDVHGDYGKYDLVFSGHSHYPHIFTKFYDADNAEMRNKHAVMFINPGSVGQPRNHNPLAQYMIFDSVQKNVAVRSVAYDVEAAMRSFDGVSVDLFYRDRLKKGI